MRLCVKDNQAPQGSARDHYAHGGFRDPTLPLLTVLLLIFASPYTEPLLEPTVETSQMLMTHSIITALAGVAIYVAVRLVLR